MRNHLEDAANRVAGTQREIDLLLHAGLTVGVGAAQQHFILCRQRCDRLPRDRLVQTRAANCDHVAENFDAQLTQQQFGDGPGGHARRRLACRRALQNVTRFGKVVLHRSGKVGMTRPRRRDALVFRRIAFSDRQRLSPVLPVVVGEQQRDRRTDGLTMTHAAENACRIALDAHASATAIALLPPPQFAIDEGEVHHDAGWHARKQRHQRLSVRLTRCRKAQHRKADCRDRS